METDGPLGIIAGSGSLPRLIIASARKRKRPVFVIGLQGHTDQATLDEAPHIVTRMGKAGTIVKALRREGVTDVVMAGAVPRPTLVELRPDWYTARLFARLARASLGDDGLLRGVAALFEKEGFRIVGAADLVGELTVGQGILGKSAPSEAQQQDIERGIRVVTALGLLDVGQAAVVQQGIVLGVEGVEGTDSLIARCGKLARSGAAPILVKFAKPQQDNRVDLPTIGPGTIQSLIDAGCAGIAIEADRTIVLDQAAVIALADKNDIFVVAAPAP